LTVALNVSTSSLGWVVIPRRALSENQLEELVDLLRAHGYLRRSDGRSVTGRLLAPFLRRPNEPGGV
jgi:hypothetical protein